MGSMEPQVAGAAVDAPRETTDGFNLVIDALKLNGIDTIYGLPGIPITATLPYTNAQLSSSLGRNLAACGVQAAPGEAFDGIDLRPHLAAGGREVERDLSRFLLSLPDLDGVQGFCARMLADPDKNVFGRRRVVERPEEVLQFAQAQKKRCDRFGREQRREELRRDRSPRTMVERGARHDGPPRRCDSSEREVLAEAEH